MLLGFAKLYCFYVNWAESQKNIRRDTTTSKENIFTFNINHAWYDDEFCQSMDHDGKAFKFLRQKLPHH
jgi:hypothetical protein